MKKLDTLYMTIIIALTLITINGCDPFDDIYLTLSMDTEFNVQGIGPNINIGQSFCLSEFEDYSDNKDNLEEIRYISSIYLTLNATTGLQGDSLVLTLYEADHSTVLLKFVKRQFVAAEYINNPLEIAITQQEIDNINLYLSDPKIDKCFWATLQVSNVQSASQIYSLNSKVEFLTELKIKP